MVAGVLVSGDDWSFDVMRMEATPQPWAVCRQKVYRGPREVLAHFSSKRAAKAFKAQLVTARNELIVYGGAS